MQKVGKIRAFVTGADGFIGTNLVNCLVKNGWKLKVLIRRKKRNIGNKNIDVIYGDLVNQDTVSKGVKGTDVVFNLAALLPHHKARIEDYRAVNVTGVENILRACNKYKIGKLVHISTVGIYGNSSPRMVNENSPRKLSDDYSRTKAEGEDLVFKYIKDFGLRATIIKPTIAYGPADKRPVFSTLFKLINKGLFIPVGDGENYLHTIYVGNLVDALVVAAKSPKSIGEDFIVGDEPCPTMGQIVRAIALVQNASVSPFYIPDTLAFALGKFFDLTGALGLPAPLNTRRVKFMTEDRKFSIDKAKRILGYKPKVGLKEGMKRTYKWYKENGYL